MYCTRDMRQASASRTMFYKHRIDPTGRTCRHICDKGRHRPAGRLSGTERRTRDTVPSSRSKPSTRRVKHSSTLAPRSLPADLRTLLGDSERTDTGSARPIRAERRWATTRALATALAPRHWILTRPSTPARRLRRGLRTLRVRALAHGLDRG